ncbi:hypothetical protein D3C73_781230 [compost metagenome]
MPFAFTDNQRVNKTEILQVERKVSNMAAACLAGPFNQPRRRNDMESHHQMFPQQPLLFYTQFNFIDRLLVGFQYLAPRQGFAWRRLKPSASRRLVRLRPKACLLERIDRKWNPPVPARLVTNFPIDLGSLNIQAAYFRNCLNILPGISRQHCTCLFMQ